MQYLRKYLTENILDLILVCEPSVISELGSGWPLRLMRQGQDGRQHGSPALCMSRLTRTGMVNH